MVLEVGQMEAWDEHISKKRVHIFLTHITHTNVELISNKSFIGGLEPWFKGEYETRYPGQ